jgi:hypothetical protein
MIANSKIALSFAAGALLASGIVYVALKPSVRPPRVAAAASVPPGPPPSTPAPVAAEEPALPPAPAAAPEESPAKPDHPKVVHEAAPAVKAPKYIKPPIQVARVTPPADDEVPASVREDPVPAPQQMEPPSPTPAAEPVPAPEQAPAPEPGIEVSAPAPTPPPLNHVTLQPGTVIAVRLSEALSSDKNEKGDSFFATLDQPLAADGFVIAERGARVEGKILDVVRGARGGTPAQLSLSLNKIHTSDGQEVAIETTAFDKTGDSAAGENAAKVGGGAVLGAVIGAMAGGGKGAGIGAAAGGAAGAGGILLTRGRTASLPTETRISFRLQQAVTITERPH